MYTVATTIELLWLSKREDKAMKIQSTYNILYAKIRESQD